MAVLWNLERTDNRSSVTRTSVSLGEGARGDGSNRSGLQIVLFVLNGLLLFCAALQLFTPHFEIMFVLSIGLTSCYFWYVL